MSEPRFTRGEYWVLESVVESMQPLQILTTSNLDEVLNKPPHGLGRDRLLDTLVQLVEQGLIRTKTDVRGEFVPRRNEIGAALDVSGPMWSAGTYYLLTSAGGAAWEAFAAPQWDRFIDSSSDEHDRWEATCASRPWLEQYVAALRREGDLDEASLVWDEVAPWQATYWKQLPSGHRARFRWRDDVEGRLASRSDFWLRWYQWG